MKPENTVLAPTSATASPYVDKEGLAARPGLSRRTIDNWMQRGLPHLKLGPLSIRFDLRDVESWIQRSCRTMRYGKL